jgi:2-aminoadipate transaminase
LAKQWADLHTDHLSQAILLEFARSGSLEAHQRRVIASGRERLHAALDACRDLLPEDAAFTRPQGGMNLWVTLSADTAGILESTRREGVTFLPGKYFAVSRPHDTSLRLSFAGLDPDQVRRGIAVIANQARAHRAPAFYQSAMAIV